MESAFIDLLNSDWHDYRGSGRREDRLDRPGWVATFLKTWGFRAAGPAGPAEVERLRSLRTLLRRMVDGMAAGGRPARSDLERLNAVMAASPLVNRVAREAEGYSLEQSPIHEDWDGVMGAIALSFAEVLANHDPTRIKVCENPDCGWVFYDESKSRTRRWCESGTCGNLVKVRRYRARVRGGELPPEGS